MSMVGINNNNNNNNRETLKPLIVNIPFFSNPTKLVFLTKVNNRYEKEKIK